MRNRFGGCDEAEEKFGWLQVRLDGGDVGSDFLPDGALPWTW